MRHAFTILLITLMTNTAVNSQSIKFEDVRSYENQLLDVTEIVDTTYLKHKLTKVENEARLSPNELNKAKLGIIYHEVTLNLSFLSKTNYKGYAKKSFDILAELASNPKTTPALMPIICAYRASALALVGAETKKMGLLGESFTSFDEAINNYATVSSAPEFLRGSVAENLPWFFFGKRKAAENDFQSIIEKQRNNPAYADSKIMSFTYWAWANQHQAKKYRQQSMAYLDLAIKLDPNYQAGRQKAEALKAKLM